MPVVPAASASAASVGEKKTYDAARLQIRVPSGPPLVHSLPATSTLGEVVEWVKGETGLASVTLTCSFPRCVLVSLPRRRTRYSARRTDSSASDVSQENVRLGRPRQGPQDAQPRPVGRPPRAVAFSSSSASLSVRASWCTRRAHISEREESEAATAAEGTSSSTGDGGS